MLNTTNVVPSRRTPTLNREKVLYLATHKFSPSFGGSREGSNKLISINLTNVPQGDSTTIIKKNNHTLQHPIISPSTQDKNNTFVTTGSSDSVPNSGRSTLSNHAPITLHHNLAKLPFTNLHYVTKESKRLLGKWDTYQTVENHKNTLFHVLEFQDSHIEKNKKELLNMEFDMSALNQNIILAESSLQSKSYYVFLLQTLFTFILLSILIALLYKNNTISRHFAIVIESVSALFLFSFVAYTYAYQIL